jgi:hypothetical protein
MEEKMLKALMKKKKSMSDTEKDAKKSVLGDLKKMAEGVMGEKIKGLKKVSVSSDSPEGLKAGLEKAEEIIGSEVDERPEGEEEIEESEDSMFEESKDESEESLSEEELDKQIQELMKKKEQLKK